MSEKSQEKCLSLKKKDKIQKNRKAEKPKSIFVSTPKRIHTISLRERLLQTPDKRIPNNKTTINIYGPNAPSNSPNGRVGSSKSPNSPNGRVGPNEQSNSPIRQVGSTSMPSSRPCSSLLRDRIEPALVSSLSESPLVFNDLKTARTHFLI